MSAFEDNLLEISKGAYEPAPPCVFVLFGATGDLVARKIAPALANLHRAGLLNEKAAVLGVARRPRSDEQFRDEMLAAVRKYSRDGIDEKLWKAFAQRWHYHVTHADEPAEYDTLAERLNELDEQYDTDGNRLFYLAMTPAVIPTVLENLSQSDLARSSRPDGFVRIVMEKPFGHDLNSAHELNQRLLAVFDESQIFRIDHYLGKETVQNILAFRFANAIFEPLLDRDLVDHVQITTAETVGMEGRRGPYYETAGALCDMIQNHMLQLLALMTMEAPLSLGSDCIRQEKLKLLKAVSPPDTADVPRFTVRGQYGPGRESPAYHQEKGVAPDSMVETYAAVRLHIENRRWAGVPFYLRTGKRLAEKAGYVVVVFKPEPLNLFTECPGSRLPNRLVLRIVPNEGISLVFDAKTPGPATLLRPVKMDFRYDTSFESASPEAYEHLLLDAARGTTALFLHADEVEAAWRVVDSIRGVWETMGEPPLYEYAQGSWGPLQAKTIFDDPYRDWFPV